MYHMVVVDIFVQIGLVGNMGYVAAVYAIAVLCALISHYLVDDTVARIFNKKKLRVDEVKEEKIEEKMKKNKLLNNLFRLQTMMKPIFKKTEQSVFLLCKKYWINFILVVDFAEEWWYNNLCCL